MNDEITPKLRDIRDRLDGAMVTLRDIPGMEGHVIRRLVLATWNLTRAVITHRENAMAEPPPEAREYKAAAFRGILMALTEGWGN